MDYRVLLSGFERHHDMRSWPRQRVIHACLRAAIMDGSLAAGTRLMASRALAAELGIARNTVIYAYDQLATEGLVLATSRGTVVAPIAAPVKVAAAGTGAASLSRRMRSLQSLPSSPPSAGAFAPGVPALSSFPVATWRRALDRAWRSLGPDQLDYPDAAGVLPLREAISAYLAASRGVRCDASQVFVTIGTQASLELCARAFADAGDTAWIENPGYMCALAAFRAAELRTIGIVVDEEGMCPAAQDWHQNSPRLVYTTPSHQYPTGTVLGMQRRLALIERAKAHGALIIEDDYDSEFRYEGPPLPAMQGLGTDAPVVYLGTFSKTLFPAIRTGYMVVPPELAAPLRAVLPYVAPHGRMADQLALASLLQSGQFGLHLRRMRRLYRSRRDLLLEALQRQVGSLARVHGHSAGIHLALQFAGNSPCDADVASRLLEDGIVARALSAHTTGLRQHGWNGLLLGYSQVEGEYMDALAGRLARAMRELTV